MVQEKHILGLTLLEVNSYSHNLDVMHIEKNVFENIFNTLLDVKGKSKDNGNARKDIELYF